MGLTIISKKPGFKSTFRYKIIRQLGHGGMGRTFLAHEYDSIDTFRLVALKMLHTPDDPSQQNTFVLEAKLMRLMSHPNILTVYGFKKGSTPLQRILSSFRINEPCESFIVMEYVSGSNLADFVRVHRRKKIAVLPYMAAYIVSRIARGLAYAHDFKYPGISAHGVIHRDISPGNILIHEDGRIKISDFGIAYPYDPHARNPQVCGTPGYIALEVLSGDKPTVESDIYGAGLLLELMLTGKPRYLSVQNKSPAESIRIQQRRILNHIFQADLFQNIPPTLVNVCAKATASRPENRYQSANQLALDLEAFLKESGYMIDPEKIASYLNFIQSPNFVKMEEWTGLLAG